MAYFDTTKWADLFEIDEQDFQPNSILMRVVSTLVVIIVLLVIRRQVARYIRKQENLQQDVRRRWLVQLRNGTFLIIVLCIVVIWAQALQNVAIYLFAIAMATVIATKELIQCITGSITRASVGSFKLGDRIEIGDFRGDVIDMNILTTTILEIGPKDKTHRLTGRSVSLPNSFFLTKPIINECYTSEYVLHVFSVPMKTEDDWDMAEKDLLEAAREQSASYLEEARHHFNKLSRREGLMVLSVDPHVTYRIPAAGTVELVVRLAAPARQKGRIEQAIIRQLMNRIKQRADENKKADEKAKQPNPEGTGEKATEHITTNSPTNNLPNRADPESPAR